MASLVKKASGLRERCEERMPRMAGVGRGGFEATNELDLQDLSINSCLLLKTESDTRGVTATGTTTTTAIKVAFQTSNPQRSPRLCLLTTVYILGQLDLSYSLALVHSIIFWLIWAEIICNVQFPLPKWPMNKFKPIQLCRHQFCLTFS